MKRLFPRGVRLALGENIPRQEITSWSPRQVLVPLYPKGVGLFSVGTAVKKGDLLGEEGGFAPENGVVQAYREIQHPLLGKVLCVELELLPEKQENEQRKPETEKNVFEIVKHSGIVEECSGEILWKWMERMASQQPSTIAVDALEDEPLSPGGAFFAQNQETVLLGLKILAEFLGVSQQKIAWNSKEVGKAMENLPESYSLELRERYPAWTLYQEEKKASIVRIGPQAAAALAQAMEEGIPQTHTAVIVAGNAVSKPQILWVPIGTRIQDLLEYCGVGTRPCVAVMGNKLGGYTVTDGDMPIVAASQCITAWKPEEQKLDDRVFPCIGCGKCQRACPKNLEPWLVQEALGQEPVPQEMLWRVEDCCQCGVCQMVCPSGINLPACMKQAAELRKRGGLV